jgi:hypothetical protein
MSAAPVDFTNVQGLVRSLYRYPLSRHLLFEFGDGPEARGFLQHLLPMVTTAAVPLEDKPEPLLNIGLTFGGLAALGVDPSLLQQFDAAFKDGPDPVPLGDALGSRSDPANWWEKQFSTSRIHCVIHLHCTSVETLLTVTRAVRQAASVGGVSELLPRADAGAPGGAPGTGAPGTGAPDRVLDTQTLGDRKLHFGYSDGFSQPDVVWSDPPVPPADPPEPPQVPADPNQVNFRHFILGYATDEVQSFPLNGAAADLVRTAATPSCAGSTRTWRCSTAFWRHGLATRFPTWRRARRRSCWRPSSWAGGATGRHWFYRPSGPIPSRRSTMTSDTRRTMLRVQVPVLGPHRIVNPRDQALDPVAAVQGVPRVPAPGRSYGAELKAGQPDDGQDRAFWASSSARTSGGSSTPDRWMKKNTFSPVFNGKPARARSPDGQPPVGGTVAQFIIPRETQATSLSDLPDFIHTKGTAFLLLPSLSLLKRLGAS